MSVKKNKKDRNLTPGSDSSERETDTSVGEDNMNATQHAKKERNEAKLNDERHDNHGNKEPAKKKDEAKPKSLGEQITSGLTFLKDVQMEARKITWPPRKQVAQETWTVIVLVSFITVLVLGFDYALGHWVFGPIEHWAKLMAPQSAGTPFTVSPGADPQQPLNPAQQPNPATPAPGATTPPAPAVPGAATPQPPATSAPAAPTPAPTTTTPGAATPPATTPTTTTPGAATPPAATPQPVTPQPATPAPTAPTQPSTPTPNP